ncbi:MAG: tetratricopeptide repeat protein, partial [Chthoniobacteraceae bacterium]
PSDGTVWTEHLLASLRQITQPSARQTRLLDFQSRHAIALTSSKDARAWLARSLALDAQGRGDEAKTALRRCLEINPSAPALLQRQAERTAESGDPSAAVAIFDDALRAAGDDTALRRAILLDRSAAFRELGRFPEAGADNLLARNLPARRPEATPQQLDLSPFYNSRLDEDRMPHDRENTLTELQPGLHLFAGTSFDVRGLVQFGNDGVLSHFPRAMKGVPIGARCRQLHLLQAAAFVTEPSQTPLAEMIVHYEDGQREVVPQVNGRDIADWWTPEPEPPLVAAWRGSSPFSRAKGGTLCLFKATWNNPRPDVVIRSVDYVSVAKSAAPIVVAITVE